MVRSTAPIVHTDALSRFARRYQSRPDGATSRVAGCTVRTHITHRRNATSDRVHYYIGRHYCGSNERGLKVAVQHARGKKITEVYYRPHWCQQQAAKILDDARRNGHAAFAGGSVRSHGSGFVVHQPHVESEPHRFCLTRVIAIEVLCRMLSELEKEGEKETFLAA